MNPDLFYEYLIADVADNASQLPDAAYTNLRNYYRKLLQNKALRPFHLYNWRQRTAPMIRHLHTLPVRSQPWRILDAGCGVGTESLLWSAMREDVTVLGVDVHSPRLETAVTRLPEWEKRLKRPLSIQFQVGSIFDILAAESVDLIWTMEAISHIDPAEQFLQAAWQALNPGGILVISDSHLASPAMAWRIYQMRRRGIAERTMKTMPGGETISYANERLFTVPLLTRLLYQAGFKTVQTQISIYFPPRLLASTIFQAADRTLNLLPLVRYLGGIYTISAHK
jgi:2-polyprenyl-3-methyl-5-hydroxy-6-metoxy-1,4-benzoquinol methylase